VATGAVPCTKVTGKWLFPRAALDRWLAAGLVMPALAHAPPPPIVGGSHDPLLEWTLRESGSGLASLPEGTEAGLRRLARGEVTAAAIHLHRLDGDDEVANLDAVAGTSGLHDVVVIAVARREQGLVVAAGNPMQLRDVANIAAKRARLALRPQGAGASDRRRYRPGGAIRSRRLRRGNPRGRASGESRFRAADMGALRPGAAPARLFPAGSASAVQIRPHGGIP
jgi:putative molybdopterin biosynthesis protein